MCGRERSGWMAAVYMRQGRGLRPGLSRRSSSKPGDAQASMLDHLVLGLNRYVLLKQRGAM
jgi:hypothetical protein